jgi:hypothetical protein
MVTARAMGQTRLGQLLVFTGFIFAGTTSFGIPQIGAFRQHLPATISVWFVPLLTLTLIAIVASLACLVFYALRMIAIFTMELPLTPKKAVLELIAQKEIDKDETLEGLTSLYLDCIEANEQESARTGNQFRKSFKCLCTTLALSAFFAILVLVGNCIFPFKEIKAENMSKEQPAKQDAPKPVVSQGATDDSPKSQSVADAIRAFGTGKICASEDLRNIVIKTNQRKPDLEG